MSRNGAGTHFTGQLALAWLHQAPSAPACSLSTGVSGRNGPQSLHVILTGEKVLQFLSTISSIQQEAETKLIFRLRFWLNHKIETEILANSFQQYLVVDFRQDFASTNFFTSLKFVTDIMNIFCSYNCLRTENLTPISSAEPTFQSAVISNLLLKFKFWFVHNLRDCSRELQVSGADFLCIYHVWGRSARA